MFVFFYQCLFVPTKKPPCIFKPPANRTADSGVSTVELSNFFSPELYEFMRLRFGYVRLFVILPFPTTPSAPLMMPPVSYFPLSFSLPYPFSD